MKRFRVWLLVLLCVVLPLRGALATTLVCPTMASGVLSLSLPAPAPHCQDGPGEPTPTPCAHCVTACTATPMPTVALEVPAPADLSGATFPAPSLPDANFVGEGLERPPRSC